VKQYGIDAVEFVTNKLREAFPPETMASFQNQDDISIMADNMEDNESILKRAYQIVEERSEEKTRQYGPFSKCMERSAEIATAMCGKKVSTHDMFIAMVALKFARQSFNFKEDNLLDALSYIGAWQNYIDETGDKKNS